MLSKEINITLKFFPLPPSSCKLFTACRQQLFYLHFLTQASCNILPSPPTLLQLNYSYTLPPPTILSSPPPSSFLIYSARPPPLHKLTFLKSSPPTHLQLKSCCPFPQASCTFLPPPTPLSTITFFFNSLPPPVIYLCPTPQESWIILPPPSPHHLFFLHLELSNYFIFAPTFFFFFHYSARTPTLLSVNFF